MIPGTIILANERNEYTEGIVEWYAEQLRQRGRKNVRVAYHNSDPYSDAILREMNSEGVNTIVVLPLLTSEGKMSVWKMPKQIGMPDNSCS